MLPGPRMVCQEPGLRPIGRSPGVPDKSSRVHIIGPPSHWSPISLVPHLTGPPSHWSPISLIPQLAPMHHSFHWSPISLVPPTHWSPISLVPFSLVTQFISPPLRYLNSLVPLLIGPPFHYSTHFRPIPMVPHLTGPPSHWSPN